MKKAQKNTVTRRGFVGAAAGSAMIVKPSAVRGTQANSAIRMGLLGCGSRGTVVADAFLTHPNVRMVALADLFQDNLEKGQKHFNELASKKGHSAVDSKQMFVGPKAFEEIANSSAIDMVQISSPDYFHPEHLNAVVDAGKHVYCEKPAAVDVEGCLRFMEIGKKAKGRLSFDVGFNVREGKPFWETIKRIHAGAIGTVACIDSHYHAPRIAYPDRGNASPLERRIRNFYWDRILSGDVLVDQNIHMIDMCNWTLGAHPVKVSGAGGRKVRYDASNVWDHWSVRYTYPNDVIMTFNSVQFGDTFWDVGCRFFGDEGVAECYYTGAARIISREPWDLQAIAKQEGTDLSTAGSFDGLAGSDETKTGKFVKSITSGKYHNESRAGAISALSAIMGRMAAYSGKEVTWDEMIQSRQSYAGAVDFSKL